MPCGKKKKKVGRCTRFAMTALTVAFLQYEIPDPNGMTKICVYDSYRGQHTIVVKAWQLCPHTIRVD